MNKTNVFTVLISILLLSNSPFSVANVDSKIELCRIIKDDIERLTCYDKIPTAKAVTKLIVKKKDDTFGLGLKELRKDEPELIHLTVKKVKKNPYGILTVTFTDGQKWKQIDSTKLKLKAGNQVIIRKAALGSFFLQKPDSSTSIRIKRIK